jgi:beta-galactosidase
LSYTARGATVVGREANVECHGAMPLGRLADDPGYRRAFVSRASRMARRDKNHACVVVWSLGNESGYGSNLRAARDWLRAYDYAAPRDDAVAIDPPTAATATAAAAPCKRRRARRRLMMATAGSRRPVQYEGGGSPVEGSGTTDLTDIVCPMYNRADWVAERADDARGPERRPVILCEYAHAMGNSSGGLERYWRVFRDGQ